MNLFESVERHFQENESKHGTSKHGTSKYDPKMASHGRKKRRTAYSSGRRELFGMKKKRFIGLKSDLKKASGKKQKDTKKRTLSRTAAAYRGKWRQY